MSGEMGKPVDVGQHAVLEREAFIRFDCGGRGTGKG